MFGGGGKRRKRESGNTRPKREWEGYMRESNPDAKRKGKETDRRQRQWEQIHITAPLDHFMETI